MVNTIPSNLRWDCNAMVKRLPFPQADIALQRRRNADKKVN
jgi:hypothetical protein